MVLNSHLYHCSMLLLVNTPLSSTIRTRSGLMMILPGPGLVRERHGLCQADTANRRAQVQVEIAMWILSPPVCVLGSTDWWIFLSQYRHTTRFILIKQNYVVLLTRKTGNYLNIIELLALSFDTWHDIQYVGKTNILLPYMLSIKPSKVSIRFDSWF